MTGFKFNENVSGASYMVENARVPTIEQGGAWASWLSPSAVVLGELRMDQSSVFLDNTFPFGSRVMLGLSRLSHGGSL